jgi:hypothetical protein
MDWWRVLKIYAGPAEEDADPSSYPLHDHSWEITEVIDDSLNTDYDPYIIISIKCSICGMGATGSLNRTTWGSD